jgi:hypothetical protein
MADGTVPTPSPKKQVDINEILMKAARRAGEKTKAFIALIVFTDFGAIFVL